MSAINRYLSKSWTRRRAQRAPDQYLAEGEETEFVTNRHLAVLVRPALLAAIMLFIAFVGGFVTGPGGFTLFLWWLTVPFILWLAWRWFEWRFERIVLTNRRFIVVSGLIIRKVGMMPFSKVTDLGYTRSVLGRLLGYGGVRLESAGQVQDLEHVNYIPDPDKFYRELSRLVLGPGPRESEEARILREIRDRLA